MADSDVLALGTLLNLPIHKGFNSHVRIRMSVGTIDCFE
jgi:hypothetical protein